MLTCGNNLLKNEFLNYFNMWYVATCNLMNVHCAPIVALIEFMLFEICDFVIACN
jgi:hypothetical protein